MTLPSLAALALWLPQQRWFAGKGRRLEGLAIESAIPLGGAALVVTRVRLDDGTDDRYAVPLRPEASPEDALDHPPFMRALLEVMATRGRRAGESGAITGHPTSLCPASLGDDLPLRRIGGEQSNTSIAVGEILMLKQVRRLLPGINPEEDITRFLTERTSFRHAPRLLGSLVYEAPSGEHAPLAVAHELIGGAEDGWRWTLEQLRALGADAGRAAAASTATLTVLRRLGERTGQLHAALASDSRDPDFAPVPISDADLEGWTEDIRRQVAAARDALGGRLAGDIPDPGPALAGLRGVMKIRHHGDFHLGQTLILPGRGDVMIVDFEGEPLRPLSERRRKHAAARDVAGMLRSISYAAASEGGQEHEQWREAWERAAGEAFTSGYLAAAGGAAFLPSTEAAFARAVAAFELEKAAYEVVYETRHRPSWLPIPVRGLVSAAARVRASASSASG